MKQKILIILLCLTFSSSVYGATFLLNADQSEFKFSPVLREKTNRYNYAAVTLTKGPVLQRCTLDVYVEQTNNSAHRSYTGTFYTNGTSQLRYPDPFDSSTYHGAKFKLFAKIRRGDYIMSTSVEGDFTP